jgi:hypothetical protein
LLFFAVLLGGCASTKSPEGLNCEVARPPSDSAVNMIHGTYVFVYPRNFGEQYSGCQTMWGDDGNKWYVLRVANGKPTELTMDVARAGAQRYRCLYNDTGLVDGDIKVCPDFGGLKRRGGLGNPDAKYDAPVPADLDLRGK